MNERILQPPGDDARVFCPIAAECGGCALIDKPYGEQLTLKHERTLAALARYPELRDVAVAPVVPAPEIEGYRSRAKLACARVGGRVLVGLYHPGTHDIVDLPACNIEDPMVLAVAQAVRRVFAASPFDALCLTYISVRASRVVGRAHLTFVLSEDSPHAKDAARALLAAEPALSGVALNLNPGPPLRVFGPGFRHLAGEELLDEALGDRTFALGPGAFFQANVAQANAILDLVREHFGETPPGSLVDLYAGAGALAYNLGGVDTALTLVEGYDAAVDDARAAATRAGFTKVRVVHAAAERVARDLAAELGHVDRVIVNPPRKGCAPDVLAALAALAPERAAYVSCDPTTLARDLAVLRRFGYEATAVIPVDMLPQTDHIEAVALLERRGAPGVTTTKRVEVIFEDDEILVVDKPPHVPVHEGTDTRVTLLSLLAEDRGEAARSYHLVHRLDAETSGVMVLAKDAAAARALSKSFDSRAVGKRYLCLARGITRDKGVMNRPLAGKRGEAPQDARTKYRSLFRLRGHTLCAVTPETGRLHQIRRHMQELDHPLIGDDRYGDPHTNRHFAERYAVSRVMLHAAALVFPHPKTGALVKASAPLPGDMAEVLARLGLERTLDTAGLLRGLGEDAPLEAKQAPETRAISGRPAAPVPSSTATRPFVPPEREPPRGLDVASFERGTTRKGAPPVRKGPRSPARPRGRTK